MATIESSTIVSCDREKTYDFIKNNIEQFPKFIPNIKKLKLLQRLSPNKIITEWAVDIDGASVRWKEEDIFDDKNFCISFRMVEGDYAKYEGRWQFENTANGTKVYIAATLDWGIPNLGKHVGPVLEQKAKLNFRSMLWAIRKQLNKNSTLK